MAGTKVKVSGFEMQFSDGVEMNDFYQELELISRNRDINVGAYSTRVYTRVVDKLAVGLILTFKDDRKKLASEEDGSGKLKVNRIELKEHQTSTEASLFCFNPLTGCGVFTHYAGAASASVYAAIFGQAHKNVKDRLINQRVDEYSRGRSRGDIRRIKRRAQGEFGGTFSFKYIYQEKDLNQILDNLKSLSEVEVITELGIPDEPVFRHLGALTKKTTQTITFLDQFKVIENLKGHLSNFIHDVFSQKNKKYALRLIGSSLSGQRVQYWIGDNVEEYGFFDYDEYIDELPDDVWDNYLECSALSNVSNILKNKSETFGELKSVDTWNKYQSAADLSPEPDLNVAKSKSLKSNEDFKDDKLPPLQIEMCL
ncbi:MULTISPECIES: hypothetical protein [Vibrio]|uniref:hypothetical protein n=1 Tax=Vibrio TaxID=662 RepID=UPI00021AA721|nr:MULTISPECIES: hypothetical protein [Vibrio]EGQ8412013.1 hypothetical protein [Vibrio cholerae]EGS74131.1 hypothetical protein VCBJG01_2980 [Vibrio cholerae BJG-01]EHV2410647.1 hypothetical protein [Vibrio cholerae]RBM48233.1 hypothetical protein DLR65_12520 [Vibrio tarriae]HAS3166140.1 hypothetical protein [Vibrio cholerae]